jgi:putative redox protein
MEERIGRLRTPLMVFHSPIDNTVGIDNAARIFKAAKHPKSFVSLDDADHLLRRKEDARYVGTVLSAWTSRYLGHEEEEAERPDVDVAPGSVYVGETGEGKFSNHVLSGPHYLRADEPEEVGGDDSGPSPYDLLTAGLGACTSMTLRMYANHKGIEVEKFEVFLEHEKIHAKDCEECESDGDEKIDRIERRIRITGDVDQKTRERMVQIADKCPVHNTLAEGNNKIVTKLDE